MNTHEKVLDELLRLKEESPHHYGEIPQKEDIDSETRQAITEIDLSEKAVILKCKEKDIDVNSEWKKFCDKDRQTQGMVGQSNRYRYFFWGAIAGVAASIIAILILASNRLNNEQTIAQSASTASSGFVTLTNADGEKVNVTSKTPLARLFGADMAVDSTGNTELFFNRSRISYDEPDGSNTDSDGKTGMRVLKTPAGKDFKLTLADGTIVWVNSESSLEFPTKFSGNTREVRLFGEAYFQVAKDAKHPFIIHTEGINAKVLGTELYVSHLGKAHSSVALINGKVEVSQPSSPTPLTLKPGQEAKTTSRGLTVENINTDVYTYWREGYFYFNDMPLYDVMQKLGKWYNAKIVFEDNRLKNTKVRYFCVREESLERAVTILNHMKQFKVVICGNTVVIKD